MIGEVAQEECNYLSYLVLNQEKEQEELGELETSRMNSTKIRF
jgi:hypothetical protein